MKLITFDESKKIAYFKEPILQCNRREKVLNFTLRDKDPEETITTSFDNIFIRKNYILCSMDQDSSNAIIVVFSIKENCDKIYNAINEAKSHQPQSAAIDENNVFKENFYIPLIKAVQQCVDGFQDLKNIILGFVNSLDTGERTYYFSVLAEFSFFVPCSTKDLQRHLRSNSENISAFDSEINDNTLPSRNARKRSFNNISREEDEFDESYEESYAESVDDEETCFDEPTPENSSSDIIFDFVEFLHHGKPKRKLLIFTSPERTHCYEFEYHRTATKYQCLQYL
uniref:Uncharacterized protein n=1 Tax=Panagrolaimus davidi TaxID=227884 RepID=A0A914QK13_9BILA